MPTDVITKGRTLQQVLDRRATVNIAGHTSQSTDIYDPSGLAMNVFTDSEISGIENWLTSKFDDINYYST